MSGTQHPITEINIEVCHNCKDHQWCTHHDESRYNQVFAQTKAAIEKELAGQGIKVVKNQNVGKPQVGAFEISANGIPIFSKISTRLWPLPDAVAQRVKLFVEDYKHGNDVSRYVRIHETRYSPPKKAMYGTTGFQNPYSPTMSPSKQPHQNDILGQEAPMSQSVVVQQQHVQEQPIPQKKEAGKPKQEQQPQQHHQPQVEQQSVQNNEEKQHEKHQQESHQEVKHTDQSHMHKEEETKAHHTEADKSHHDIKQDAIEMHTQPKEKPESNQDQGSRKASVDINANQHAEQQQ